MGLKDKQIQEMVARGRSIQVANAGDETLGPLMWLPGIWKNTKALHGYGFNMIALPYAKSENRFRLLMNQYDEELHFSIVDKGVPNRGFGTDPASGQPVITDQTIVALDYDQKITQIASQDFSEKDNPHTGINDRFDGQAIHKEPGLWLYMTDENTDGINVGRLGTIPHGNSILALGRAATEPVKGIDRSTSIPRVNGVVVGGGTDPNAPDFPSPYFDAYKFFHNNPFKGSVPIPGFDGFEPVDTTALLRHALEHTLPGKVKRSMALRVDSTLDHAGVVNIPFVVRQADAASMNSTFIIYEVEDAESKELRYFMQYVQNVILDFLGRPDGHPGRARWPHISINTMERISIPEPENVKMRMLSK